MPAHGGGNGRSRSTHTMPFLSVELTAPTGSASTSQVRGTPKDIGRAETTAPLPLLSVFRPRHPTNVQRSERNSY